SRRSGTGFGALFTRIVYAGKALEEPQSPFYEERPGYSSLSFYSSRKFGFIPRAGDSTHGLLNGTGLLMDKPSILIVGTLDTKRAETLFLRSQILAHGSCSVKILD